MQTKAVQSSGRRFRGNQHLGNSDPIALLRTIEHRAAVGAAELPRQDETEGYWDGVAFMLAGQSLLLPTSDLVEILTVPEWTRVPGAKSWVKGISNVRGNLMTLLDMREFLLGERQSINRHSGVLVIDHEGTLVGLIVDEVLGMRHFPEGAYRPGKLQQSLPGELAELLVAGVYHDDQVIGVLGRERLLESEDFLDVAA